MVLSFTYYLCHFRGCDPVFMCVNTRLKINSDHSVHSVHHVAHCLLSAHLAISHAGMFGSVLIVLVIAYLFILKYLLHLHGKFQFLTTRLTLLLLPRKIFGFLHNLIKGSKLVKGNILILNDSFPDRQSNIDNRLPKDFVIEQVCLF